MIYAASFALPLLILAIIVCGFIKRVPVFDSFIEGAKQSIKPSFSILPSLVGLVFAVSVFKASGALDVIVSVLSPIAGFLGIPGEVVPLAILSPVSGSGSLAVFQSILTQFGPDSFIGRVASVMMGSSETTFYAVTVYFGAVGVKKTRHTIPAAITADITCFIMSALFVRLILK